MRTIVFVDTYYQEVLKANPLNGTDRDEQLAKLCFGTSNFYSNAFKRMGWHSFDIIGNDNPDWNNQLVFDYLLYSPTNIIYCQDLCYFSESQIKEFKNHGISVVGQISSKWPGDNVIKNYDILFTSFPHYIPRFEKLGVKGVFLPIAFGEEVLQYVTPMPYDSRDIDISFVGGLGGANSGGYWTGATELFEMVAKQFTNFKWFGYFIGDINNYPNLRRSFAGTAWGADMYRVYARSKIVLNRHGEVSESYSNNMRMFEATGMGACLFTEASSNLNDYFEPYEEVVPYHNTGDIIYKLDSYLDIDPIQLPDDVAEAGQIRTLKDHTYSKRLAAIEPILARLIK